MGIVNFHVITGSVFDAAAASAKNTDHLYFVDRTSYMDLYKGNLPIGNPNTIKTGDNATLASLIASGNITTEGQISGKSISIDGVNIAAVASQSSNGLMSSTDKATLDKWAEAKENHLLNGTIKIGSALLSYSNDALKVTFIEE